MFQHWLVQTFVQGCPQTRAIAQSIVVMAICTCIFALCNMGLISTLHVEFLHDITDDLFWLSYYECVQYINSYFPLWVLHLVANKELLFWRKSKNKQKQNEKSPGIEPGPQGLSYQCSAAELRWPDNHQPSKSFLCTAQVVLKCLSHTPDSQGTCLSGNFNYRLRRNLNLMGDRNLNNTGLRHCMWRHLECYSSAISDISLC